MLQYSASQTLTSVELPFKLAHLQSKDLRRGAAFCPCKVDDDDPWVANYRDWGCPPAQRRSASSIMACSGSSCDPAGSQSLWGRLECRTTTFQQMFLLLLITGQKEVLQLDVVLSNAKGVHLCRHAKGMYAQTQHRE